MKLAYTVEHFDSISAAHRTGISGTMAAAVCGLNRRKNRHDVYAEIMGLAPETAQNQAMRMGKASEPIIRAEYEIETGDKLFVPAEGCVFRSIKYPWMIASPDGLIGKTNEWTKGFEAKCAGVHSWKEWGDPEYVQVPQEYYCQCLHYMVVLGVEAWDMMVSLCTECNLYPLKYDERAAIGMVEHERKFWGEHIQAKVPPPVDHTDACARLMSWMHPEEKEPMDFVDASDLGLFRQFAETTRNEEAERLNKQELQNRIKALIGEREGLRWDGGRVTWKKNKAGHRIFRVKLHEEK